jgi:aspartyl/asparaginyl-tRNA synthetase
LAKAYEDNEVNADKNYKNKTVLISGKVSDIGVVLDQTYVVLSAEKEFAVTQVQCFFQDKPEIDKVATLKKGDNVKIQGVVEGKSMNVSVRKCVLK